MSGMNVPATAASLVPGGMAPAPNRRVAVLGDSRGALGLNDSAANKTFNARGILDWARFLCGQRFDHDLADVYATSNYTSQDVIDNWLTPCAASTAGTVVILVSTNDRPAQTAQWTIDRLTTIETTLLAKGKIVVWIAEMPRGNTSNTADRLAATPLAEHYKVVAWLRSRALVPNVYVADVWPVMADQTVTTGDNILALFTDGKHQNQAGAYVLGTILAPILNQIYTPRNIIPGSRGEVYDATYNPTGTLTPNVTTSGTGGTVTAPAAGTMTGSVADSHTATLSNGTGVTVTLSKVTDANGKFWQQAVISGTPSSASCSLQYSLASVSTLAADVLDVFCELQVDTAQTGINQISLVGFAGTDNFNFIDLDRAAATDIYPAVALSGVMRSPRYTRINNGTLAISLRIMLLQSVAVSATIRFRALGGRKIVSGV